MTKIKLISGDITDLTVDAIVNAANKSLLGGGGIDGAIHRAAGPELLKECSLLGACKTGEAKITKAYKLPAKFIIHTVGPIYGLESGREEELLTDSYRNSLLIAKDQGIKSIAFPCISTGAFRFPKDEAARIAIKAVKSYINEYPDALEEIVFVTYGDLNFKLYQEYLNS